MNPSHPCRRAGRICPNPIVIRRGIHKPGVFCYVITDSDCSRVRIATIPNIIITGGNSPGASEYSVCIGDITPQRCRPRDNVILDRPGSRVGTIYAISIVNQSIALSRHDISGINTQIQAKIKAPHFVSGYLPVPNIGNKVNAVSCLVR